MGHNMQADTPKLQARKPTARSRVTNGSKLGSEMDGRTVWARRLRDLIELYSSDIGPIEAIPHSKRSLIRRAAVLTVELERAEVGFAEAGEADPAALTAYQTTSNALRRILDSLDIKVSLKEASDIAKVIEGGRAVKMVVDNMSLGDRGIAFGRDRADYALARRIAFAVKQASDSGEPLSPALAALAVELSLAEYTDNEEGLL
jgi:hypothetical protein